MAQARGFSYNLLLPLTVSAFSQTLIQWIALVLLPFIRLIMYCSLTLHCRSRLFAIGNFPSFQVVTLDLALLFSNRQDSKIGKQPQLKMVYGFDL